MQNSAVISTFLCVCLWVICVSLSFASYFDNSLSGLIQKKQNSYWTLFCLDVIMNVHNANNVQKFCQQQTKLLCWVYWYKANACIIWIVAIAS